MDEHSRKKGFLERLGQTLGRGVAQGWEVAKETSSRFGELAGLKLDLKNARDRLESRYRQLGRLAADRWLDGAGGALDPAEEPVRAALEEIRAARAALEELERKCSRAQEAQPPDGTPGA